MNKPNYVVSIREVNAADIPLVGGKGANLGELTQAGLPVPQAFCVTTQAYETFIRTNNLRGPILAALEDADYDNVSELASRARRIRDLVQAAPIPADIQTQILSAHSALQTALGKDLEVSVRSSATAEDLPGMSFAGQQDTYLSIRGADRVLEHIKRCWGSLWTDRAISYRHRQGFRHEDVLLAVVVQEMFPSEVAGVMFTANPMTSNPNEILLNTSWGLGEAIVSGRVNPDQYLIDKQTLELKEKLIQDKKVMTVRLADGSGSHEENVPENRRTAETLSDAQVKELAAIGLKIEKHYGFPQDIEWGFSGGRFALLQSREVTAADLDFSSGLEAYQHPEAFKSLTEERWVWSRAHSDETQTGPSTPYHYTVLEKRMTLLKHRMLWYTEAEEFIGFSKEQFEHIPMYRWYGARAYYNLEVEKERIRRFIPPFARDESALWPFPANEREAIKNMPFNWPRFLWIMVKLHITNPKISLIETPYHMIENLKRWTDHTAAVWSKVDMEKASVTELFETEMRARGNSEFLQNAVMPFTVYLYVLPAALRTLCAAWFDDKDATIYSHLVSGLSTKTGEENVAIWNLAGSIRKHPELSAIVLSSEDSEQALAKIKQSPAAAEFLPLLEEFLKHYGHRGGAERDAYHKRYRHKPANVLNAIKPMLKLDEASSPQAHEHKLIERREATLKTCLERLEKEPLGPYRTAFFKWLTNLTQQYYYYRDFERFWNDRDMSRPRDILLAIARKFIARKILESDEDIFFLGREEIADADGGRLTPHQVGVRVRSRRRVYDRYRHKEPPKYLQGWRKFDDEDLADDEGGMRGIGASRGTVTGRARVCRKLEEISKIEKGDILVTVATDPGWTTVFSIISGVVVETGGVVAHAVMISREYGLPCVANLTQACDLIPDGATITLNGSTGRVVVHDAA